MNQNLSEEIEIPEGISVVVEDNDIIIKKDNDETKRKLNRALNVKIEGNKIIIRVDKSTKNEKKIFGSEKAHIKNMIRGLADKFKYKLQAVSVHFPMNISIDKEKNELVVKNFLGEKIDRRIKLIEGVEVKVDKDVIEIESSEIEKAGQCAANIEKGTHVRKKDRRVYQDGIYITKKPRRNFL